MTCGNTFHLRRISICERNCLCNVLGSYSSTFNIWSLNSFNSSFSLGDFVASLGLTGILLIFGASVLVVKILLIIESLVLVTVSLLTFGSSILVIAILSSLEVSVVVTGIFLTFG